MMDISANVLRSQSTKNFDKIKTGNFKLKFVTEDETQPSKMTQDQIDMQKALWRFNIGMHDELPNPDVVVDGEDPSLGRVGE